MTDILGSIGVAPFDGLMAIRKRSAWSTVQQSGYPTAKVVIRGLRANQLRAQSQEPLNCWLDYDHTSAHRERCAHVGNTRWVTEGGDERKFRSALTPLVI